MYRRLIIYSIGISSIVMFILHFSLCSACAETETFIKEYTFTAGEADSKLTSRTEALREVKRLLLEELGTYLESINEVKDFKLTKDQIITLTAGIVSAEIMEETWDGKTYWLKAKISADRESVVKSIDELRQDRQKVNELEEMRKGSEALLKENNKAPTENKKAECENVKPEPEALGIFDWFHRLWARWNDSKFPDRTRLIERLDRDVQLRPNDAKVYVSRGVSHLRMGNSACGCSDLAKACSLGSCKEYERAKANTSCR